MFDYVEIHAGYIAPNKTLGTEHPSEAFFLYAEKQPNYKSPTTVPCLEYDNIILKSLTSRV